MNTPSKSFQFMFIKFRMHLYDYMGFKTFVIMRFDVDVLCPVIYRMIEVRV